MTPTPTSRTDILIVGAGPTGLTLAVELARRGVPLRIIDQEAERTKTSRAIGTQARTADDAVLSTRKPYSPSGSTGRSP